MRYYTYNELDDDREDITVTLSEEDILALYAPHFLEEMKKITGEVPAVTDELILDNWIVINWAWETDINGNTLKQN